MTQNLSKIYPASIIILLLISGGTGFFYMKTNQENTQRVNELTNENNNLVNNNNNYLTTINQKESEIQTLQNQITSLSSEKTQLQNQITSLTSSNSQLTAQRNQIQAQYDSLNSDYKYLQDIVNMNSYSELTAQNTINIQGFSTYSHSYGNSYSGYLILQFSSTMGIHIDVINDFGDKYRIPYSDDSTMGIYRIPVTPGNTILIFYNNGLFPTTITYSVDYVY